MDLLKQINQEYLSLNNKSLKVLKQKSKNYKTYWKDPAQKNPEKSRHLNYHQRAKLKRIRNKNPKPILMLKLKS